MPQTKKVEIISINWDGPFEYNDVIKGRHDEFSEVGGLYQIYCNHFEDNTLMYIGMTENSFGNRIKSKSHWLDWESKLAAIYLEKIVSLDSSENHAKFLRRAEMMLIYFCAPPVNNSKMVHMVQLVLHEIR